MTIDVNLSGLDTTVDVSMGAPVVVIEDYDTLAHKPQINGTTLSGNKTSSDIGVADAVHTHTKSDITDFPTLATVATSGSYNDLSDTPTIPTDTSDLTNGAGYITSADIPVTDVQVDGTSVVSGGVASIPKANASDYGALKMTQHTGSPLERYVALEGDATYNVPYLGSPSLLINAWHLPEATQSVRGAMSASDKTKLDSIPDGGTTGQVLTKASGTDYDLEWATPSGGASAFVAEFNVTTYADVKDAYDNDAILICTVDDSGNTMTLQLVYFDVSNEIFYFAFPTSDGWYWTQLSNADGWDDGTHYFASTDVATQLADGLMSALDKQKLDGLSKRNIWYGTCSTSASQSPKAITTASGDFSLTAGNMLVVKFSNTNSLSSASLQVDGGTSKSVYQLDGTSNIANRWGGGEVVMFAYDGTKFILLDQSTASTTQYGITKLNNTVTSTSTSEAATANAVKEAYDNGGVQSVNGSTGAVTLTIPTDTSDLTNGAGFVTASEIYPVGAVFETTNSASNPSTLYGGTWQIIGQLKTDADVELETDDGEPLYGDNNISMERTYRYSRISLPT